MDAKFLFGLVRTVKKDLEEIPGNIEYHDALYITRKTDVFMHSDMAKICGFRPGNGGFVKRLRQQGGEHYYGESVSCRVSTDESMEPLYRELTANGQWWKLTENYQGRDVMVFCVTKAGYKPVGILTGVTWTEAEYADVYPSIRAEYESAHNY